MFYLLIGLNALLSWKGTSKSTIAYFIGPFFLGTIMQSFSPIV